MAVYRRRSSAQVVRGGYRRFVCDLLPLSANEAYTSIQGFERMEQNQLNRVVPVNTFSILLGDDPTCEYAGWFVDHDFVSKSSTACEYVSRAVPLAKRPDH